MHPMTQTGSDAEIEAVEQMTPVEPNVVAAHHDVLVDEALVDEALAVEEPLPPDIDIEVNGKTLSLSAVLESLLFFNFLAEIFRQSGQKRICCSGSY